jgi:hypothetical protein
MPKYEIWLTVTAEVLETSNPEEGVGYTLLEADREESYVQAALGEGVHKKIVTFAALDWDTAREVWELFHQFAGGETPEMRETAAHALRAHGISFVSRAENDSAPEQP